MKIKLYLMLLISVMVLQSYAGRIKTDAAPSLTQRVDYDDAVVSEKKHTVTLTHYTEFKHIKHKIIFSLLVRNRGTEPLSISNENISTEFIEGDEDSVPIKLEIQPLDDFMKDLENDYSDAEYRIINDIFNNTERTADRIRTIREKEVQTDVKVMAQVFASSFYSSRDDLEETVRIYEQLEGIVPPLVFKPQTIMPGRSVTGLIVYDTGDIDEETEGDFNVVVSIEGEEHRFVFSRSS